MNVNLYYFSGTGNSLFIAKTIKEVISGEHENATGMSENQELHVNILPIQKFQQMETIRDQSELIGIIYPTYFLDAPAVVQKFAKRLQVSKTSYLFLYANYGETLGNALYNMNKLLGTDRVLGNYEVALPDNSIIFETRKEEIPKMLEAAESKIRMHAKEIYDKKVTTKSPYSRICHLEGVAMKPIANTGLGFNKMKVDKTRCNGCHLCEKLCPMKNIYFEPGKKEENTPVFGKICESCFSCLHFCPKEAISYKRMSGKKKDFQYSHPQISVKEMMDAQIS